MSIYRDTFRTPQNVTFELGDVARDAFPLDALSEEVIALLRKAAPAEFLLRATVLWLEGLPADLQPTALCERFPRIANELSSTWDDPIAAHAYFAVLLLDTRGGRQGFPVVVLDELLALQARYEVEFPAAPDLWQGK